MYKAPLSLSIWYVYLLFGLSVSLTATEEESGALGGSAEEGTHGEVQITLDDREIDRSGAAPVLTSYADTLDPVRAAVVSVFSTKVVGHRATDFPRRGMPEVDPLPDEFWGSPERRRHRREREVEGLGSGVILSSDGYIMTNHHVIDQADEIRVALTNRDEYDAVLVGADPRTDVAVLKIEAENLPYATIADSDKIRVGDIVFAVGNPLGVGQTVTMGIVSATGRSQMGILGEEGLENFIQTDAAINRGNSGGALVDAYGRVVGINTAIISGTGGSIGIGFAIPVNMASNVMQSLVGSGRVVRGSLGVQLQLDREFTAEMRENFGVPVNRGALVRNVRRGLAADKAGMRSGDVIMEVDGEPIYDTRTLQVLIAQLRPGEEVSIVVIRDGEEQELSVLLGDMERAEEEEKEFAKRENEILPGIQIKPLTDDLRAKYDVESRLEGMVITEVREGSPHAEDFREGTVIIEINQRTVSSLEEAQEALRSGRNMFLYNFEGSHRYKSLRLNR
ncbi:MAG: Do family serine endopeptidase [Opitutales bacterium]|nr:Do family serine endopeptidase [Opitutales bacterium]